MGHHFHRWVNMTDKMKMYLRKRDDMGLFTDPSIIDINTNKRRYIVHLYMTTDIFSELDEYDALRLVNIKRAII